jgi:transcriptional regulator with XRE-family HTH domain
MNYAIYGAIFIVVYVVDNHFFGLNIMLQRPLDHVAAKELIDQLSRRRKELGMSMAVVAQRSGVGMRTVQRVLSGLEPTARLSTVLSIAQALGLKLQPIEVASSRSIRWNQAKQKAAELAGMVQGTSALEAQAIPDRALRQIEDEIASELVRGPRRQLWSS